MFSIADTVDMKLLLDRLINCRRVLQPNSPKHDPCLKDACLLFGEIEMADIEREKHRPLPDLTDKYKRYLGPSV